MAGVGLEPKTMSDLVSNSVLLNHLTMEVIALKAPIVKITFRKYLTLIIRITGRWSLGHSIIDSWWSCILGWGVMMGAPIDLWSISC